MVGIFSPCTHKECRGLGKCGIDRPKPKSCKLILRPRRCRVVCCVLSGFVRRAMPRPLIPPSLAPLGRSSSPSNPVVGRSSSRRQPSPSNPVVGRSYHCRVTAQTKREPTSLADPLKCFAWSYTPLTCSTNPSAIASNSE